MPDGQDQLSGLELRSRATPEGRLELTLERVAVRDPGPGEVVVRVEAAPINPTDLGLLLGGADPAAAVAEGEGEGRRLVVPLSPAQARGLGPRVGLSLCPGLEGAGTVVAAGPGVEPLVGRAVAAFGGAMFARHRTVSLADCLLLPPGTAPRDAATAFVNPLTVLGMVETLRAEGHRAMVHTAAASNLGLMLARVCAEEGIDLVNVVRRPEQAAALREGGAAYVCDGSAPDFADQLAGMVRATGATLAFDATGGGTLAATILRAMERAQPPAAYSPYGSSVLKQVYVYGRLEPGPTELAGDAGTSWGVGGWLMMNRLARLSPDAARRMKDRVLRGLGTTFHSEFAAEVGLEDLLDPATLARCGRRATGGKHLLVPAAP